MTTMATIAQQLKIKEFPFEIRDSKDNLIYFENFNGYWSKREFDSKGNLIYFEDSNRYWFKSEYDSEGNEIYYENSNGYWAKQEYDSNSNLIYFEDSTGLIIDKHPKTELTLDEIAEKFGIPVNKLKIIIKHLK